MAEAAPLIGEHHRELLLPASSVVVPRSFSYRLDSGSDLSLGSRRSSSSSRSAAGVTPRTRSWEAGVAEQSASSIGNRGTVHVAISWESIWKQVRIWQHVCSNRRLWDLLILSGGDHRFVRLGYIRNPAVHRGGDTVDPVGAMPRQAHHLADSHQCASFALNAELDNFQNWTLPQDCITNAQIYVDSGQYYLDFARAIDAARTFLRAAVVASSDGQDMVNLDLDDTMLSSLPLLRADLFNLDVWDSYVELATMPPLGPMLSLYQELRTSTACNCKNLNNVGYEDYIFNLRSEPGPVVEFKTMPGWSLKTRASVFGLELEINGVTLLARQPANVSTSL